MTNSAVPRAARAVARDWQRLATPIHSPGHFDPSMVAALPEPARRYLEHAIAPGTPLAASVVLSMHGEIRLGSWRRFTATQVLAPPDGFVWAATARIEVLTVSGFDRYSSATGQMRWRLLGIVPVMSAAGPDVTRSAAGRLAAEGTVFVPTSFPGGTWSATDDPDTAQVVWRISDDDETVRVRVDSAGRLVEVRLDRWGNPDGQRYDRYPFGVEIEAEASFDGIVIPTQLRAGWWWDTDRQEDGEFFRAEITAATFLPSSS